MKYCIKCGTQLPDNALFCFKCGEKCDVSSQSTPPEKADTTKQDNGKNITTPSTEEQATSSSKDQPPTRFKTEAIPPSYNIEWYYTEENEEKGPISESELIQMAQQGQLTEKTTVREDFMNEYRSIYASKIATYLPKEKRLPYSPAILSILFFLGHQITTYVTNFLQLSGLDNYASVIVLILLSAIGWLCLLGQVISWAVDRQKISGILGQKPWIYCGIANLLAVLFNLIYNSSSMFILIPQYQISMIYGLFSIIGLVGPTIYIVCREKYEYKKRIGSILAIAYNVVSLLLILVSFLLIQLKISALQ